MKTLLKFMAILIVTVCFSSCSSTKLTSTWKMEGYTEQPYKRILVFAIASSVSNRGMVESAMVNELKDRGFNASSSLSVFPETRNRPAPDQMISKEQLVKALQDNHIDGLLILSLLDVKEEQVYIEGHTHTEAAYTQPVGGYNMHYDDRYNSYYSDYYAYYNTVYTTVTEPGYYDNQTTLYLESNFYHVNDGLLVWSGQAESLDPTDLGTGAKEWAHEVVVRGLMYDKIIMP